MSLYGNAMAALKCTVAGDLPNIDKVEVEHLISSHTEKTTVKWSGKTDIAHYALRVYP